jgi:integrase
MPFTSGSPSSWSLPKAKILTKDEIRLILGAAKESDARDYVFFATAVNTGLRLSEVLHIKKEDLVDGRLRITRRKKKIFKPQMIDVVPQLWEILAEWGQMFESGYLFPGDAGPCFVEGSKGPGAKVCDGGHISKRSIQRRWDLLLTNLDLKMDGRGVHTTRHAAITNFYQKHKDLMATQAFAGHSSPLITQVYCHVLDMKEKIVAMEAMI